MNSSYAITPGLRLGAFTGRNDDGNAVHGASLGVNVPGGQLRAGVYTDGQSVVSGADVTQTSGPTRVYAGAAHDHTASLTTFRVDLTTPVGNGSLLANMTELPLGFAGITTGKREFQATWNGALNSADSLRLTGKHVTTFLSSGERRTLSFGVRMYRPDMTLFADWKTEARSTGSVEYLTTLGLEDESWKHEVAWRQQCLKRCIQTVSFENSGLLTVEAVTLMPTFGVSLNLTTGRPRFSGGLEGLISLHDLELSLGAQSDDISAGQWNLLGAVDWKGCPVNMRLAGNLSLAPDTRARAVVQLTAAVPIEYPARSCEERQRDTATVDPTNTSTEPEEDTEVP